MVIKVSGLNKYFGGHHVLKDISIAINGGEVVSIIGPSGSGKSTFLRCINYLEPFEGGEINVLGSVLKPKMHEKKDEPYIRDIRTKVGMVFQSFNLFPHMNVLENIIEAPCHVLKKPREEAEGKAMELLKKIDLVDKAFSYPHTLSGGQKQRVAIARALAMEPEIMLFDEPTSSLDPELAVEVLETIKNLAIEGKTMVIVTHQIAFVRHVCHKVLVFDEGRIIEQGDPDQVFINPCNQRTATFLMHLKF